jgi:hypothetical protein
VTATVRLTLTGGEKLRARLRDLAGRLGRKKAVRVGFFESATYLTGRRGPARRVADVAAYNEFGSPAAGRPPRPFFRMTVARGRGHWGSDLGKILRHTGFDAERSLGLMGELIAGELRQQIVDFASPPLAASTVKKKGFAKPLVGTGTMLRAVDYRVE